MKNNSWEIEKLNLVKEISKAMSYDYSEYDAMSNNDTPEEVAVNLLDDFITKTLQQQREDILEEITNLVKENRKGSFTDDGGNDCWYIDELVIELQNLKQENK